MKILLPTDFSGLSKVAIQYAAKMGQKLEAELILLHVVNIDTPSPFLVDLKVKSIEDALVDNAKQDFIELIKETKSLIRGKLKISYKILKGYPFENVVSSFAYHNDISLIILGTKGATGMKKVLIGSNATALIKNCDIPVITVPELARFKNLKHIVYATDLTNLDVEMKFLVALAKMFDSTIHLLHILSPQSKRKIDAKKIFSDVIKKSKYKKITFQISIYENIIDGISEFIVDVKADILVMFTNNAANFGRLFDKSITRKMAFQNWIPLLTIKR